MISVRQAEHIISGAAKPFPIGSCAVKRACGRILREDITSDRDQPPFDKALMDGIAIVFAAWKKGERSFLLEGVIAAGQPGAGLKDRSHAVQIMTGAVVPKGCDCVIPIEQARINGGTAYLKEGIRPKPGQFIRRRGTDAKKGAVVLSKGMRLDPPRVGAAVSVGRQYVRVSKQPRVAVIATGDELVDIGRPIKTHQTRLSNSYSLQGLLVSSGLAKADIVHLPDDENILLANIRGILKKYDIVILSGGVSAGKFDYVPQVLKQLGVKVLFHKVAQKPGGPFWFGTTKTGKPVFALPGNPASTLVCAYRYVMPYLAKAAGAEVKKESIAVKGLPVLRSPLTRFLPVKDGKVVPTGGSGDFAALAKAEGFIEYDANKRTLRPYFSWRP